MTNPQYRYIPKDKSPKHHQPKGIDVDATGKYNLAHQSQRHVNDGPPSDAKHSVQQEATDEAHYHVWPGINGIEQDKLGSRHVQICSEIILQRSRIVVAKVRSCNSSQGNT